MTLPTLAPANVEGILTFFAFGAVSVAVFKGDDVPGDGDVVDGFSLLPPPANAAGKATLRGAGCLKGDDNDGFIVSFPSPPAKADGIATLRLPDDLDDMMCLSYCCCCKRFLLGNLPVSFRLHRNVETDFEKVKLV